MEDKKKIHVSIIGIDGLPAAYGGFETLVDRLLDYKRNQNISYTVFCSKRRKGRVDIHYKGERLKYLRINSHGISSIIYDIISILLSLKSDILLILGVSGCILLPIIKPFYNGSIITNIDGLEWKRSKWNKLARFFLKFSEKCAVNYSDIVIGDNQEIINYISEEYRKKSLLIEYGSDHAFRVMNNLDFNIYNYASKKYAISVCRIEPENNIHLILKAFSSLVDYNLVLIGNWENSSYGKKLYKKYGSSSNLFLLPPEYNTDKLNLIRSNAYIYIHGHSAGGTNPSLVEAMSIGLPIIAFDCKYNRFTTEYSCLYWKDENELIDQVLHFNNPELGRKMKLIAENRYRWQLITEKYETLYTNKKSNNIHCIRLDTKCF